MHTTVIIAAAGKGKRIGRGINKQYLELEKKPILLHTLSVFDDMAEIDEILVVIGQGEEELFESRILKKKTFKHTIRTVFGGAERQDSIENALNALSPETELVLSHDGARPLVEAEQIRAVIQAAEEHGAAILAVPVKDTIKVVGDGFIESTPQRSHIWAAQTPQVFHRDLLMEAYRAAKADGVMGTDDAMLLHYGS